MYELGIIRPRECHKEFKRKNHLVFLVHNAPAVTREKMIEREVYKRLLPFVKLAGGVWQFEFRRNHSTVIGMATLGDLARPGSTVNKCYVVVTLDFRSPFNSAN